MSTATSSIPAYSRPLENALGDYVEINNSKVELPLQQQAWKRVMQVVSDLRARGIRGTGLYQLLMTSAEATMKEKAHCHPYVVEAYRNHDHFIFQHLDREHIIKMLLDIEMQGDDVLPDVRPSHADSIAPQE